MISKLLGRFFKMEINEKNVLKQIHDCLGFWFSGNEKKSDYLGVMGLRKRPDLKATFVSHAEQLGLDIARNANPHYALREAIVRNIRVVSTYSPLVSSEFEPNAGGICDAINRGMRKFLEVLASDPSYATLSKDLLAHERFGLDWSWNKVVHEAVWADAEYLVLRHLQAMMFEKVEYNDWSSILKKAYEDHIKEYYRLMLKDLNKETGWFHPTVVTSVNEHFVDMESKVLTSLHPTER
jgi:hypothetical protein